MLVVKNLLTFFFGICFAPLLGVPEQEPIE